MHSAKTSPSSSRAGAASASTETKARAITERSVFSLHFKEALALSVLLRLHKKCNYRHTTHLGT